MPTFCLRSRNANLPAATPFSISLKDLDFNVQAGEIVGIAGVAGNGQSELFQLLSGEDAFGEMTQSGCAVHRSADAASMNAANWEPHLCRRNDWATARFRVLP